MNSYLKRYILKQIVLCTLILIFACISTYVIYNKFQNERDVDYASESLEIIFHEKSGANIDMNKVIPVTDGVGLANSSYTFTVNNNLTEEVNYKIKLIDNVEKILEDECSETQIDKSTIRVSIKEEGKKNKIYTLDELENNTLLETKINALKSKDYTIRVWVSKDSTLTQNSDLHYHSLIKVVEEQ